MNSIAVSMSSSEIFDDLALAPKLDSSLNLSVFPFNIQYAAFLPHPKGALVESQPIRA